MIIKEVSVKITLRPFAIYRGGGENEEEEEEEDNEEFPLWHSDANCVARSGAGKTGGHA